jgi:hypothetical protein
MSNNYWDDEDDDTDTTSAPLEGNDLLKQLRKAKRADEKRIKELSDQLDGFNKAQKESIIKKVLESYGVSQKAARLISREFDGDISEEAVSQWIDDNAEVFGIEVQYAEDTPENSNDNRAALRQQDIVTQGAITPERAEDMNSRLNNAESAEEIINLIYSQQQS